MIDTHAHLVPETADEVVGRAVAAGVGRVVSVATSVPEAPPTLKVASRWPGVVFACLGIHPHEAGSTGADDVAMLREYFADPTAVAVGETGLDYFRDNAPKDAQRRLFDAHLDLASELGKPIVIHTRSADEDTLAALAGFQGTVILHCFSSLGLLETACERGWYCSFAGNVTYPKAVELHEAARRAPLDRLLAETDSTYLAPQPHRGQTNEPAYVMHTLGALAELRGMDPADLERQIDANATRAFAL